MSARERKLRRLDQLRRSVPYVSASALSKILDAAVDGIPEIHHRGAIREARSLIMHDATPYGPLSNKLRIRRRDGTYIDMEIVDPSRICTWPQKTCEGFSELIRNTLQDHPNSFEHPWGLVLYSDEVLPGNALSFANLRKLWSVYWTIFEFGQCVLADEHAWFCVAAERSENVKEFDGGIAQLFTVLLKYMFAGPGHQLQNSGVLLDLYGGGSVRTFLELRMFLQDGGAHKQVFCLKGDGGHHMCIECRNLYSVANAITEHAELGDADTEHLLTCSLVNYGEMDFATDADVRGTVLRLADVAAFRPAELELRQRACGFNHERFNMILDPALDNVVNPITQKAHDWMHAMVVHGVWNVVLVLLVSSLKAAGMGDCTRQIQTYVAQWTLPKRVATNMQRLGEVFHPVGGKAALRRRMLSARHRRRFRCTALFAATLMQSTFETGSVRPNARPICCAVTC